MDTNLIIQCAVIMNIVVAGVNKIDTIQVVRYAVVFNCALG